MLPSQKPDAPAPAAKGPSATHGLFSPRFHRSTLAFATLAVHAERPTSPKAGWPAIRATDADIRAAREASGQTTTAPPIAPNPSASTNTTVNANPLAFT